MTENTAVLDYEIYEDWEKQFPGLFYSPQNVGGDRLVLEAIARIQPTVTKEGEIRLLGEIIKEYQNEKEAALVRNSSASTKVFDLVLGKANDRLELITGERVATR